MLQEFWAFVRERETIRLRRRAGLPMADWTKDEVLKQYSFTNVKRHHDRTTQLLVSEFYDPNRTPDQKLEVYLLNAAIFRYFGTLESARMIGWLYEWTPAQKNRVMRLGAMDDLRFTSAYIVPNCGDTRAKYEIVCDIIDGIWSVATDVAAAESWEHACSILARCWGCGSFMSKEVYLDFLLARGDWRPSDWQTWTPVGPGGCRGASWVLDGWNPNDKGKQEKLDEDDALEVIRAVYRTRNDLRENSSHQTNWPSWFHLPWSHVSPNCDNHCGCDEGSAVEAVELDLTDIQFQFCEFDKYNRAKHGGKPKRKFRPTIDGVTRG